MGRFGYLAVNKFRFVTKEQLNLAFQEQWKQECSRTSDPIGKILVDKGFITPEKRDLILNEMIIEPNIGWGEKTNFAQSLGARKLEKQAIADYIGVTLAKQSCGITVFLSNSSTVFYAFLGMVKHKVNVDVLTINAAILVAYPLLKSDIKSVTTIWKGRVDLDNALIEPPDLNDPDTKSQLNCFHGPVIHALISVTGFDCDYGPMADNAIAREVSRQALQSGTHTYILMDHSKVCVGTEKNNPVLLFNRKEWNEIRDRRNVEVVVTRHPKMPEEQANLKPIFRSTVETESILRQQNASPSVVEEIKKYQEWSFRTRDILTEIPIDITEKGIEQEPKGMWKHDSILIKDDQQEFIPKLENPNERDMNLLAFERELAAFKVVLPRLLQSYLNQFVAVLNGQVIDHDRDELCLAKRIYNKYPNQFVLIRQVSEEPPITFAMESPEGVIG